MVKLTGPVEELRAITLVDFRRLSRDPSEAAMKIKDKIDLLTGESFEKRSAGIAAWTASERTAAQYGVAPLPYLTDVLTKLAAGWDADRLDELLPDSPLQALPPAQQGLCLPAVATDAARPASH